MNARNPDQTPALEEIESAAAVVACYWMDEGEKATAADTAYDRPSPTRAAGFAIAAALYFHAMRQVDAAECIAAGLRDLASAIREGKQATGGGAP